MPDPPGPHGAPYDDRPDRPAEPERPERPERPRRARRAMRVLLVDHRGRVLLFRDGDLGLDPVPHWWITPGGGVDPGESDRAAAVREVHEETGLVVAQADLVGPLAARRVVHGYSDVVTTQDELFWLVSTPEFVVSTAGHTAQERLTMTAHRWWTRPELDAVAAAGGEVDEPVWPAGLGGLLDLATGDPAGWPLDLGLTEESTVPARGHGRRGPAAACGP